MQNNVAISRAHIFILLLNLNHQSVKEGQTIKMVSRCNRSQSRFEEDNPVISNNREEGLELEPEEEAGAMNPRPNPIEGGAGSEEVLDR